MYFKRGNKGFVGSNKEEADFILIPMEEYNGLQNALRIVRDRAMQQIDKSKCDEHGYKLLRADLKPYKGSNNEAWHITKQTPYSSKIQISDVQFLIVNDLKSFYSYVREEYEEDGMRFLLSGEDYCKAKKDYLMCGERKFLVENSKKGEKLREVFDRNKGIMIFRVDRISVNHAAGVYEISYWATSPV